VNNLCPVLGPQCPGVCRCIALHVQAAAKAKKVVDKEKKARDGLKKIEVGLAL